MVHFGSGALSYGRATLRALNLPKPPHKLFFELQSSYDNCYMLESVVGPKKLAEYTFMGFDPKFIITARDGVFEVRGREKDEIVKEAVADPFEKLRSFLKKSPSQHKPRLLGGAVGYISYDCVRHWERLPGPHETGFGFPDLEMGMYEDGIVYDHREGKAYYYYYSKDRSKEFSSNLERGESNFGAMKFSEPKVSIEKEKFEEMVRVAKEYIAAGDIFQVVLSKRYEFDINGEPIKFYEALRRINPSPYMYYLKIGNRRVVGSSPEMLARIEGRTAETFPIAGTRPYTGNLAEDVRLKEELINDPKDRAEHVMLVDLARNDVGRVSEYGTVSVPEFMTVHEFSHVQHIVSCVRGKIREGLDAFDAVRAIFPAGTLSGAPKVRAMEIINELEPTKREVYGGAVGYFSLNGNADFAITIRTLAAANEKASIQVGAGIVADSNPEAEWFETEHKAAALLKALEVTRER